MQASDGRAGSSARREYERRRDRRQREDASQPRLARIAHLAGRSPSTQRRARGESWLVGAEGEEFLGPYLESRCPKVALLHACRMPKSRGDIDHIAVAPSGVYVIDTKRYRGKVEVRKPLFGHPALRIAGRDRTKLLAGLARQVAAVNDTIGHLDPVIPVHGCLCFVAPRGLLADSGIPPVRTLTINGYDLLYPRRLAKRLNRAGPLTTAQAHGLHANLARSFPPA